LLLALVGTYIVSMTTGYGNYEVGNSDFLLEESDHYVFYSSYWLNMHQFLYQQAKKNQLPNIKGVDDEARIESLSEDERNRFDQAINYYEQNIIEHHLLFGLNDLRVFLQRQQVFSIDGHPFGEEYDPLFKHLNAFSPIYRATFWPVHHKKNNEFLESNLDLLKDLETEVIPKLSRLAQAEWLEEKVRVDFSVYTNGVGAYTATRPEPNVVISSADVTTSGNYLLEIVFHESSHLLFTMEDPWRVKIYNRAEELGMEFPRNLWHASLFYLSGRTVQDALAERGIEHEMYMVKNDVFSSYNDEEFREALKAYYNGDKTLDQTVDKLLGKIN